MLSGVGCIESIAHYYADIYDADKWGLGLIASEHIEEI
jgi:hypothetical protein